jgi:hypothetical protein
MTLTLQKEYAEISAEVRLRNSQNFDSVAIVIKKNTTAIIALSHAHVWQSV